MNALHKKYSGSYLLLISIAPIFILYWINFFRSVNVFNLKFSFNHAVTYAYIFELLLMTIAVSMRFGQYKKEKEKYQEELISQQIDFSERMLNAQETERKKISRNLHDGVGQILSSLKMRLAGFLNENAEKMNANQREKMQKNVTLMDEAYQEVRNISHELMPKSLQENGLVPALETLMQITFDETDIEWHFESLLNGEKRFEENIEVTLYRIVQEIYSNILKHAQAKKVQNQLYTVKNTLICMIEDNGKGFDKKKKNQGIGLKNIEARVKMLKGNFNIETEKGKGMVFTIRFPL